MAKDITLGSIVKNVAGGFINKTISRLKGSGITGDSRMLQSVAKWSGRNDKKDWRVRLTVPTGSPMFDSLFPTYGKQGHQLYPLRDIGGFFWPLTPSMVIQHSANYNALAQTHSNYPFQAYQNSQVDQMNIIGEFPVQNQQDAAYWVATVNFLRTVTKMFFGKDNLDGLKGNPPPILHLSGYGDHMFQKVPVVVNTFNVELRAGIDYISTRQDSPYSIHHKKPHETMFNPDNMDQTWAPTISNISVLLTPIYSRESVSKFSLSDFAAGKLSGKGEGEIGFI